MLENKTRLAILAVLILALVVVIALSIRAANSSTSVPTISVGGVQTSAVSTFAAELTSTVEAKPTGTVTATPLPTETLASTDAISPTPSCYRLKYLRDVTIPDGTTMKPGQAFTKTWQVENNGTCAWQPGFKFDVFGGDGMSGTPFILIQTVEPGGRMELSIDLTAPLDQQGLVAGTWRMADENGNYFGDALTVVIDLGSVTATPTP